MPFFFFFGLVRANKIKELTRDEPIGDVSANIFDRRVPLGHELLQFYGHRACPVLGPTVFKEPRH